MGDHFFLSYSASDGREFARRLADRLIATPPSIPVWLDERELQPGTDWDEQIVEALRTCAGLLFLMTVDSVHPKSECKHEWTRALRYKKPIIPLLFDSDAEMPCDSNHANTWTSRETMSRRWRGCATTSAGVLHPRVCCTGSRNGSPMPSATCRGPRTRDAPASRRRSRRSGKRSPHRKRPLRTRRVRPGRPRRALKAPWSASASRRAGGAAKHVTKFINPPPSTAPSWFQDRHVETELVGEFPQGSESADDDGGRARRDRQDGDGLPPAQGPGGRPPAR